MRPLMAVVAFLALTVLAHANDSERSFLLRCEASRKQLTIVDSSLLDMRMLHTTERLKGDIVIDPSKLTKTYEIKDDMYRRPAKKVYYRCKLGSTGYRIDIAPVIFNRRTSGRCGASAPSISVGIIRNGKPIGKSITFQGDCHDENVVDAVRIDEGIRSITLFSGLAVYERHIEKVFPLNAFPKDWYPALFGKWPSGNPLADLRQGIRMHDITLIEEALYNGADVNFHGPNEMSVLGEVFRYRTRAIRLNGLAQFDGETDRIVRMLLGRGASPRISTKNGASVIDVAAGSGAPVRTIRMLLDAGWPVDYQYRLYAGTEIGNLELVKEAIDHGADPNTTVRGGRYLPSVLSIACRHASEGRLEQRDEALAVLQLLLKQGATIDEGRAGEGGGDIVRTYAYCGHNPNMRPVFELLIQYASPVARANSLQWLRSGVAFTTHHARRELLVWLLKRLDEGQHGGAGPL